MENKKELILHLKKFLTYICLHYESNNRKSNL